MEIELSEIQIGSSDVEKLEVVDGKTQISCYPHRFFIDPRRVKSVFCRQLYYLGAAPRFLNHGNDLMIFQDKKHRQDWLCQQGFSQGWIDNHLLPLAMGEVIQFPEKTKDVPAPAAKQEVA